MHVYKKTHSKILNWFSVNGHIQSFYYISNSAMKNVWNFYKFHDYQDTRYLVSLIGNVKHLSWLPSVRYLVPLISNVKHLSWLPGHSYLVPLISKPEIMHDLR